MIRETGLDFSQIEPEGLDMPFGMSSGAGVIFGVTGGVTEAVIRRIAGDSSKETLNKIMFTGIRGLEGVKEATIKLKDTDLKVAVVSGLRNVHNLIEKIKSGEVHYDFVEVMACPGGCIAGAGQPFGLERHRKSRSKALYSTDKLSYIKHSEENPIVVSLYKGILKGKEAHSLLHVDYTKKENQQ